MLAPTASIEYSKMKITDIRGKSFINDGEISAILSMNIASSLIAVSRFRAGSKENTSNQI